MAVIVGWRSLLAAGSALALAVTLAACASPSVPTPAPETQPPVAQAPAPEPDESYEALTEPLTQFEEPLASQPPAAVKVGLLLPLSGARADVGQALLNAAELALFDLGGDRFTLVIRDTQGTPEGAAAAARQVLAEDAALILGPLFSTSAEAVKPVVDEAGVPMITFSNNNAIAGPQSFVMGITPRTQVDRVVDYAVGRSDEAAQRALARLQGVETIGELPFDAILLPASGQQLLSVAPLLAYYDVDPSEVRFLGTALWEDPQLLSEPTLQGGWFPAPPPTLWKAFRDRYQQSFGDTPPRVASLAYDAVALAAVLDQRGEREGAFVAYTQDAITQTLGFAGIDGIFRFLPSGQVQRGLAVLELRRAGFIERDPAPGSFPAGIN